MSLHKFADMVAKQGRGDDSLLIHMTPDEVQRLQQFAEANGRSLTINPTTGLPEAGMLSDLFKAVAPIALGAFLGPAGMGITFGGLSSAVSAGIATGGITTLATGSLSRGLMAGLGAYGGAGLGESLMGTGAAELAAPTIEAKLPAYMGDPTAYANEVNAVRDSYLKAANTTFSPTEKLAAGFNSATASPTAMGQFAKQNLGNLSAAAAPIMAGAMVPTTTSMPSSASTGFIRQKIVNPDGTVRDLTPVKASEWGDRNFSDVYRGYNGGGIVALAQGGVPGYATGGGLDTSNPIYQYFAKPETQALLASGNDAAIAQVLQDKDWKLSDVAAATGTQDKLADYSSRFVKAIDTPTTSAAEFQAMTSDVGLKDQALANAMQGAGLSQAAQYASTHGLSDLTGTGPANNFYNQFGYTNGALPGDQGGLEGYYANIKYSAQGLQSLIDAGRLTGQQAREAALAEMNRIGMNAGDLKAATGKTLAELFPDTKTKLPITNVGSVVPGGFYGNDTGNSLTRTPGDITTNRDGTVTVQPNIPGRPDGGFPGMGSVRDAYTAGGGSLGYTSKAPRTIEEFNQLYNKQTGDSLAAYNYLMGKGAYPTKSGVGEIARPYAEATLGYPTSTNKMYNWDPVAGKMVRNFDYVAPGRDAKGNVTYGMSLNDIKKTLADKPLEGQALYDWAQLNNLSAQDIADATGMKLSAVYAQFRAGSQAAAKKAAEDAAKGINTSTDTSTGGDSGGPGGGGGSGTGPGGVGGAGGPGSTSAVGAGDIGGMDSVDAKGGYYSRGKLNYRSKDMAMGGATGYAMGGGLGSLGSYSDGGRLLKGPGDGVSDSIPATIGAKQQPARLADGEFVIPARIVSELGNGSTDAGAKKLYAMMDRVQKARGKTTGKNKVAANSRADKYLPA